MNEANNIQIEQFKRKYCSSRVKRLKINNDFIVEVISYEELLPGNVIRSYATGNRKIENAFIAFKVTDTIGNVIYCPIFSETVGRELVGSWRMKLPSKMTVFTNNGKGGGGNCEVTGHDVQRNNLNRKMIQLIQFARSMMILHVDEPEPMREPFRGIYNKLEKNPKEDVLERDIKSVNTAISNFLRKPANMRNEEFTNLQEYIAYLQRQYPERNLRDFDFGSLSDKMLKKYPNETIVF